MNSAKFLTSCVVFLGSLSLGACAVEREEEAGQSSSELTAESVGVTCRTLGEIGQCGASNLCRTSSEAQCKAKASAIASDPDWASQCMKIGSQQACGWLSSFCTWEETSLCIPRSGKPAELMAIHGIDAAAIASAIREIVKG